MDKDEYLTAAFKISSNDNSKWQDTSKISDQLEMTVVAEIQKNTNEMNED